MLLTQYSNIDFIMKLSPTEGFKMLQKANEKQADSMLWDMWLSKYPWMTEKDFISFDNFKKQILNEAVKPKENPKVTKKQALEKAEKILKQWKEETGK